MSSPTAVDGERRERTWQIIRSAQAIRLFIYSAAFVLLGSGLIKLISGLEEVPIMARMDPVISFLTNRQLLVIAATLELTIAVVLFWSRHDESKKVALVFCLSWAFLTYRLGLWWMGYRGECPCLGNITGWLRMDPSFANLVGGVVLSYLLIGSGLSLAFRVLEGAQRHVKRGSVTTSVFPD